MREVLHIEIIIFLSAVQVINNLLYCSLTRRNYNFGIIDLINATFLSLGFYMLYLWYHVIAINDPALNSYFANIKDSTHDMVKFTTIIFEYTNVFYKMYFHIF